MLLADRVWEMADSEAEALLDVVAPRSRGVYALERGGTLVLVNEPYDGERVRGYEADGWHVRHRG